MWVENVCDLVGTVSKYVGGVRDGMVSDAYVSPETVAGSPS